MIPNNAVTTTEIEPGSSLCNGDTVPGAAACAAKVRVRDRIFDTACELFYRQGIRGVVRLRGPVEGQQELYHLLNLRLFGAPMSAAGTSPT